MTIAGAAGNTYRFRVTAVDPSGRSGAVSAEKTTVAPYDDSAAGATYAGSWGVVTSTLRYAGREHFSDTAGATVTFTATGTSIWLVGDKSAGYGQFQVSIDGGAYSGLYSAYSASTAYRQVLYARGGLSNATHTIKVRVYGTAGRPRVSIDAVGYKR
jgi:hypothetical protein